MFNFWVFHIVLYLANCFWIFCHNVLQFLSAVLHYVQSLFTSPLLTVILWKLSIPFFSFDFAPNFHDFVSPSRAEIILCTAFCELLFRLHWHKICHMCILPRCHYLQCVCEPFLLLSWIEIKLYLSNWSNRVWSLHFHKLRRVVDLC